MPRLSTLATTLGLLLLLVSPLWGDDTALWRTYLARRSVASVELTAEGTLWAVADGALYSQSTTAPHAIVRYDRTSGLSSSGISDIHWAEEAETLIVYYQSGMIDLIKPNGIRTIDALVRAGQIRSYTLYSIISRGEDAWLSGDFGVVQLNLRRGIVASTYLQGEVTTGIALSPEGRRLYVVSEGQVYRGTLTDNLQDPGQWETLRPTITGEQTPSWRAIASTEAGSLILLSQAGRLYRCDATTLVGDPIDLSTLAPEHRSGYSRLITRAGRVSALASQWSYTLDETGQTGRLHTTPNTHYDLVVDGDRLWSAEGTAGITAYDYHGGDWQATKLPQDDTGTWTNSYFAMRFEGGHLYTVSGGRDGNRYSMPGVVQIFNGKDWSIISHEEVGSTYGIRFYDPVDVIPHRDGNPRHIYVASWGEGLYEFDGDKLLERYDTHNSALASAIPSEQGYTRVGSLVYDAGGTLWMGVALTAQSSGGSVVSLSPDGRWHYYDYMSVRPTNSWGPHINLPGGTRWLAEHQGAGNANGILVYRDKGTPDLADDDERRYLGFTDSNGKPVTIARVSAMAVDLSGVLWLGTNIGYMSVLRPEVMPQSGRSPIVSRPIGGSAPPYYYILENTAVTAIAVDALNRKWIGTERNGVYLISDNGKEVLRHYTTENSPLVSNGILSLAMDRGGGTLYIGTAHGLNALYTGTSSADTSTQPSAIAYPNPLRPEDPDIITLTNLPADATIHISDVNGRVVHTAQSVGTEYIWNTYTSGGSRLPSGVYVARIYAPRGGTAQRINIAILPTRD